jgi:hypothetical protein
MKLNATVCSRPRRPISLGRGGVLQDSPLRIRDEAGLPALPALFAEQVPAQQSANVCEPQWLWPFPADAPQDEGHSGLLLDHGLAVPQKAALVKGLSVIGGDEDRVIPLSRELAKQLKHLPDAAIDIGRRVRVRRPHLLAAVDSDAPRSHGLDVQHPVELIVVIGKCVSTRFT